MKRWFNVTLILLFASMGSQAAINRFGSDADQIRSTFLFHIANYTNFPEQLKVTETITFCFLEDSNQRLFKEFNRSKIKRLQNLDLVGKTIEQSSELKANLCQLLFVDSTRESSTLFAMLKTLNDNTVSIGETRNFLKQGGLISLEERKSKIQIMINRELYTDSSTKFSSLLLKHVKFR